MPLMSRTNPTLAALPIVALLVSCESSPDTAEKSNFAEPSANESARHAAESSLQILADPQPAAPHSHTSRAALLPPAVPKALGPIPSNSKQLIVTLTADWREANAILYRFERSKDGLWLPSGKPFATALGKTGLGWGRGLHGGPSAGKGPIKVEGDGKSPAGVFAVGALYGYDEVFEGNTRLDYQQVDKTWRCVDDSKSRHYNRVISSEDVEVDWDKSEDMRSLLKAS